MQQVRFWVVYAQQKGEQGLDQIFVYETFIAALFTRAKMWKPPKCLLTDKRVKQ